MNGLADMGREMKKPTVLIADDSKSIVNIVSVVLRARGIETIEAYNGTKAWKLLESRDPDMAILDILMPGQDGLKLCGRIKAHPKMKTMPVMIMTSITKDSDLADGFWRLGTQADEFVTKPFDPFEMADKVEKLLKEKGILTGNEELTPVSQQKED